MSGKQNMRKISVKVTPQTAFNLERLAAMSGLKTTGRVVDKLVREKMISLKGIAKKDGKRSAYTHEMCKQMREED